jgi:hypothetical protein
VAITSAPVFRPIRQYEQHYLNGMALPIALFGASEAVTGDASGGNIQSTHTLAAAIAEKYALMLEEARVAHDDTTARQYLVSYQAGEPRFTNLANALNFAHDLIVFGGVNFAGGALSRHGGSGGTSVVGVDNHLPNLIVRPGAGIDFFCRFETTNINTRVYTFWSWAWAWNRNLLDRGIHLALPSGF